MRSIVTLVVLGLVLAGCGGTDEGALPVDPDPTDGGDATGACLEGEPDCEDDPSLPGGGQALPPPDLGDVTIADLLDGGPGFPVTARGFVVVEGGDARLCEALAESFPPQCGGLSIPVDGDVGPLESEGTVSWTAEEVDLYGEVVDGTFVVIESSAAGTCLAGAPDCADDPSQGNPVIEDPADMGESSIAEVLSGAVVGPTTVAGFIVAADGEVRLCSALAESLPPQCGGDSFVVDGMGTVELEGLPSTQGVTWSDFPITVQGEFVDGVFVIGR